MKANVTVEANDRTWISAPDTRYSHPGGFTVDKALTVEEFKRMADEDGKVRFTFRVV